MASAGDHEQLSNELPVFADERGALTLADFDTLPFGPTRAYVLHGIPLGAKRGGHAHRLQHRWLAVIAGRARVFEDDGHETETFEIGAGQSLHVPPGVWHELQALEDGLLILVLASGRHDPDDYVHERDEMELLASATARQTSAACASVSQGSKGRLKARSESPVAIGNSRSAENALSPGGSGS
jgi:quercetin dioxygenase-like cupin family protein